MLGQCALWDSDREHDLGGAGEETDQSHGAKEVGSWKEVGARGSWWGRKGMEFINKQTILLMAQVSDGSDLAHQKYKV